MAMIPYMATGYAIDRLMGGDGKIGVAAGTGFGGFSTGAFGSALAPEVATAGMTNAGMTNAVAAEAATNTMPLLMTNSAAAGGSGVGALGGAGMYEGAALGSVNPLTTGGFSESISPFTPLGGAGVGGNVGFFGQPISNQVKNSALTGEKGLLEYGFENNPVTDFIGQGTDYIDERYKNMSTSDTMTAGMLGSQAIDTMTAEKPQGEIMPPPQVAMLGSTPRKSTPSNPVAITVQGNELSRDKLEQLYKERMYG